uniref:FAR1 domain-containing protein n=1 Tax=Strongyloides venezuelensis TaxID=75913 RepID=A0A0K0EYW4_STRVS
MVIFVTINAKKRPKPTTTTCRGPPEWQPWGGRTPLNAKYIAKEATSLFKECGYNSFKFVKIDQMHKRKIDRAWRYRVRYSAKRCEEKQISKPCKRGRKKKNCKPEVEIKFVQCHRFEKKFQAIFKDDIHNSRLRLNVTNLENGNSCALIIRYNFH